MTCYLRGLASDRRVARVAEKPRRPTRPAVKGEARVWKLATDISRWSQYDMSSCTGTDIPETVFDKSKSELATPSALSTNRGNGKYNCWLAYWMYGLGLSDCPDERHHCQLLFFKLPHISNDRIVNCDTNERTLIKILTSASKLVAQNSCLFPVTKWCFRLGS